MTFPRCPATQGGHIVTSGHVTPNSEFPTKPGQTHQTRAHRAPFWLQHSVREMYLHVHESVEVPSVLPCKGSWGLAVLLFPGRAMPQSLLLGPPGSPAAESSPRWASTACAGPGQDRLLRGRGSSGAHTLATRGRPLGQRCHAPLLTSAGVRREPNCILPLGL